MKALKTNKVFFSVYNADKTESVNFNRHEKFKGFLDAEGISYVELIGVYKGVKELSLLLQSTDIREHESNLQRAIEFGRNYGQESILEVHNDDTAILHYLDSGYRTDMVGKLRVTTKEDAETRSSYSYEPNSGLYMVID